MKIRTLAIMYAGYAGFTAVTMSAVALAQQAPPGIEEHMTADTSSVLTVLRTWHNQISQDQAIIKDQAERLEAVTHMPPGDKDQMLRWKDGKWEWFTPDIPPSTVGTGPNSTPPK